MDCSELYYGGPKYKAGYAPISDDLCYAFLLEENLDRSFVGEGPNGALLKERGQGYGGIWGEVRDSLADDAVVDYQWIEAICVDSPWHRGRSIIIGDAAHACPPLIAQGAGARRGRSAHIAPCAISGGHACAASPMMIERPPCHGESTQDGLDPLVVDDRVVGEAVAGPRPSAASAALLEQRGGRPSPTKERSRFSSRRKA